MSNSSPPWAAYRALMACRLVALDKRPGVRPVGIRETLCRALAKLVMREAGEQAKTACRNLQLCVGLKAGIEEATHAVGQRRVERVWAQRAETEEEESTEAEENEEDSGEVSGLLSNINIETAVTEEEAAEGLAEALRMGGWRTRKARESTGLEGLNRHWKPLSNSLNKQSQAALRSLMPVMG